jgi:hypothetical protein
MGKRGDHGQADQNIPHQHKVFSHTKSTSLKMLRKKSRLEPVAEVAGLERRQLTSCLFLHVSR